MNALPDLSKGQADGDGNGPANRRADGEMDGRIGTIAYPSANPFEIHHILRKLDAAPPQPMFGWLLVPEHPAERMPCVVCCHGSLGWRGHHHEHMVQRSHGVAIEVCAYPGAHHSFDSVEPSTWLPDAVRLGRRTTTIDREGEMYVTSRSGERHTLNEPSQRKAGFDKARNLGAHIGGHWEARRQGFRDAAEFFREHLLR